MKTLIDPYQVIGIIGLAKNTGKTTTLNALLDITGDDCVGLTSIGLDGESIDQMTFLPKPKIVVKKAMVVATTVSCLNACSAKYVVLKKTNLTTALGDVWIVKMLEEGNLVIAGPTTNNAMQSLVDMMLTYADKVLIDGAFNRMTFANLPIIDGLIIATGASVNPDMQKTLDYTTRIVEAFECCEAPPIPVCEDHMMMVWNDTTTVCFPQKESDDLIAQLTKNRYTHIYIKGALTKRFIDAFIAHKITDKTVIVDDATKFLIPSRYFSYLKSLKMKLQVLKQKPLLFITINPFSPTGQHYDAERFKHRLSKRINKPVINVKRME